ncbi:hypothetical protein [Bacillus wiedmannii]|uniref:hypothetical protein n=1 Tax=Bacillus wiedmannii TaxID=1890302 RepID=UPI000BFC7CCA|nr:hypothetical protein [Bacillus wiedmannii]PHE75143.1 hypothetical protein COF77_15275 [Bacillus wiedmannii]
MGVKVIVVCGDTLGEAFAMLRKSFTDMSEQVKEFNDLIKEVSMYEEDFKEFINHPRNIVRVLKSQVLNRKPMLIRARTTC